MKRKERIQVTMPEVTKNKIVEYQKEKDYQFITDAILELLEFALRIKEHAKDDDSISNRELLENMVMSQSFG